MTKEEIKNRQKIVKEIEAKKRLDALRSKTFTTQQAFEILLSDKALWERTGMKPNSIFYTRNLYNSKKNLSLKKIHRLLESSGFTPSITWEIKK